MTIGTAVIEILNRDPKACEMVKSFKETAKKHGVTGEDYDKAHATVMMMAIYGNAEAMKAMANDIWEAANAK